MADSAAFEPVRRSSDHIPVAARTNEPSADAHASRPRPAGGLLRPSQIPVPGATTGLTGFPSLAGERGAHHGLTPLRLSGASTGAAPVRARPSTLPARPVPGLLHGSDQPLDARVRQEIEARLGAAAALLAVGQPKLAVNPAGDQYEREADSVASQVIARRRADTGAAGGALAAAEEDRETPVGRQVTVPQRSYDGPMGAEGGDLDAKTEERVNTARRGGLSLPSGVRGRMEGAFGADFAPVKIHTGPEAEALNHDVGALAFTVGSDIFLGRSAPALASPAGESLLAHELTHTIQQGGAGLRGEEGVQRVFTSLGNRNSHWQKHQNEFPATWTVTDYDKLSTYLWNSRTTAGILTKVSVTDPTKTYVYDPATNDFGAFNTADGKARTVFQPSNGVNYYNRQS